MHPIALYKKLREAVTSVPGVLHWEPVGSCVTCDPPPTDTDVDALLLVSDMEAAKESLSSWTNCQKEYDGQPMESDQPFAAYRSEEVNLILTADKDWFQRFMTATVLCTTLNIMDKSKRILLFQVVRGGKQLWPDTPAMALRFGTLESSS